MFFISLHTSFRILPHTHTKMAESYATDPISKKPSSSQKHKPKSGKSSLKHTGKSGHREEHRNDHQEHHEVSGENTPGQNENIPGQPETSGRMAEQLVGSYQEKLDKKRKSIPKEEAAAFNSWSLGGERNKGPALALVLFDDAKRGRDALTTSLAILGVL